MAFYTMPSFRHERDASGGSANGMYWQDTDGAGDDLFSQFLDFNPDAPPGSGATAHNGLGITSPDGSGGVPPGLAAPSSIGSASDELDFLSSSSQAHQEEMALFAGSGAGNNSHGAYGHADGDFDFGFASAPEAAIMSVPRASISESDLPRLEGISLESPTKRAPVSDPTSPTPPSTVTRAMGKKQGNKFVEALSSTIRKATNIRGRSTRRAADQGDRAVSPGGDAPAQTPLRRKKTRQPASAVKQEDSEHSMPAEIPAAVQRPGSHNQHQHQQQAHQAASMSFVQGYCDDPFTEQPPAPARFFSTANTPQESPLVPPEPMFAHAGHTDPLPQGPGWPSAVSDQSQWSGSQGPHQGWWDMNLVNQHQEHILAGQRQQQHFQPGPHGEMAFEYSNQHSPVHAVHSPVHAVQDPGAGGLMIQMPHQQQHQQSIVTNGGGGELALTAQTYLPPPTPASEPRPSRPPRAKSSGARHMSTSPMRKTRAPSASPTRRNSRHSSGGSISSVRSASGTAPSALPGTPCSVVKKRRSRDVSNGGSMGGGGGGGGGGIEVGFVNFTPSDGGVLMTGVAPSGSSKTKARREKEAVRRGGG